MPKIVYYLPHRMRQFLSDDSRLEVIERLIIIAIAGLALFVVPALLMLIALGMISSPPR